MPGPLLLLLTLVVAAASKLETHSLAAPTDASALENHPLVAPADVSSLETFPPQTILRRRRGLRALTRDDWVAGGAAAAGAAYGWSITPTHMDPLSGRVATAEAWRRRVKAKREAQRRSGKLLVRSPRILAVSLAAYSVAQYAQACSEHGPVGSLQHVLAWRLAARTCDAAARRCCAARDAVALRGRAASERFAPLVGMARVTAVRTSHVVQAALADWTVTES
jgi:hypothetical protein